MHLLKNYCSIMPDYWGQIKQKTTLNDDDFMERHQVIVYEWKEDIAWNFWLWQNKNGFCRSYSFRYPDRRLKNFQIVHGSL